VPKNGKFNDKNMQINQLANNDKFNSLAEDIGDTYTEGWKIAKKVEMMTTYTIGKRILQDNQFIDSYGKKIMPQLAKSSGVSSRTLYRCRKFATKLEEEGFKDADDYLLTKPENWTWTKEVKLLDNAKPCEHKETETKEVQVCKDCGKILYK
jgi:glutathionylspermidine synthase